MAAGCVGEARLQSFGCTAAGRWRRVKHGALPLSQRRLASGTETGARRGSSVKREVHPRTTSPTTTATATRQQGKGCFDIITCLTMVVVGASKLILFECRADLWVCQTFTLMSWREKVSSNNEAALCSEVLRDCGVSEALFLTVKLRVSNCFFSPSRKNA